MRGEWAKYLQQRLDFVDGRLNLDIWALLQQNSIQRSMRPVFLGIRFRGPLGYIQHHLGRNGVLILLATMGGLHPFVENITTRAWADRLQD
jgi:hypothetical protein